MSSLKRKLFLSVFGAAMSATVAYAADLPAPPVIEYEPETPVEIGSGWYLRGDVGFALYQGGNASWTTNHGEKRNFFDEIWDHGMVFDFGVGYQVHEKVRLDLTGGYRHDVSYEGKGPCDVCSPHPYTKEELVVSAWTLFLNGYYDFGSYSSVTPYVGGGIGVAKLSTGDYSTNYGQAFTGNTDYNFAWNVMAGASFDVSDNVKLDANYRFVSLGDFETGKSNDTTQVNPVKFKDLYAHDFRVGLRYGLN